MSSEQPESSQPPATTELSEQKTAESAAEPDHQLLDQVLDQTLSATDEQHTADPATMDALIDVAHRYDGRELTLDPVMIELVQAILKVRLKNMVSNRAAWTRVTREVAQVLLDDEPSFNRVRDFWSRLCKAEG